MPILKNTFLAFTVIILAFSCQSCKTKKMATKTPLAETVKPNPPVNKAKTDTPMAKPSMMPIGPETVAKPDFNFSNIQFEFNSAVLKTGSIQTLDHVVAEMKKAPGTHFVLNGNSSSEGTAQHNMELSIQRASSVKTYLVNSGIDETDLTVKGYGESKPIASNSTEEGRALNRRVEIRLN